MALESEVGKPGKKPKVEEKSALPLSLGMAVKGNNNDKKPMQAIKLARPGRVKVRRCKLLGGVRIKGEAASHHRHMSMNVYIVYPPYTSFSFVLFFERERVD